MLNRNQEKIIEVLEKEGIKNLLGRDVCDKSNEYICVTNGYVALTKGDFKATENTTLQSIYNYLNSRKHLKSKTNKIEVSINDFLEVLKGQKSNIRLICTREYFYITNEKNNILFSQKSKNKKVEHTVLNVQYLRKILNFISKGNVNIEFHGELNKIIFRQDNYNCLVLPIRDFNKSILNFINTLK